MQKTLRNQDGQAILEYILTLLVAVAAMAVLSRGVRAVIGNLWLGWHQEIAAPYPGHITVDK
jgi:hypothetical protein